jgi:shikimate dehydrogenase
MPYKQAMFETLPTPISAATRCCAVLGWPVRHSASPAMQNAGLAALGLDWRYLAFEVVPEALGAVMAGAKAMRFVGLNLTVPHKLLAVAMMDELDESARTWGAVNTVRFEARAEDGTWQPLGQWPGGREGELRAKGFNTDAEAIVRSIKEDLHVALRGADVVLLGAGGAGRVAALKLAAEGVANLHLVNRTQAKAAQVATEIQQSFPQVKVRCDYPTTTVDLLVNATSLGLKPEDSLPLDEQRFPLSKAGAVYDLIYRPAETPLLRRAKAAGCLTANGLGMLLYQGAKALELWSGRPAPVAVMRAALQRNVYG